MNSATTILTLLITILLFFFTTSILSTTANRPNPGGVPDFSIPGGFGQNIPGYGNGWGGGGNYGGGYGNGWGGGGNYGGGYGGGYSGPHGGRSWSGTTRPSTVCTQKGPCYKKKLTCPAKCFKAWSKSGKNYGSGGGGGGCTMDCNKCVAYC